VDAVAISGNTIYVGGDFSDIGGQPRNYIAALDATTSRALDWNMNAGFIYGASPFVSTIALSGPTVYIGGALRLRDKSLDYIAALNAETDRSRLEYMRRMQGFHIAIC